MLDRDKTYRIYWNLYGGSSALLKSKYLYISIIVTAISYPLWASTKGGDYAWIEFAFSVVPSFMGFSLGGMAILLAFSNEKFLLAIRQKGKENSLFMKTISAFFHFILLQTSSLLFALITISHENIITSFIGFFLFIYGTLSGLAIAGALLHISRIFNVTDIPK